MWCGARLIAGRSGSDIRAAAFSVHGESFTTLDRNGRAVTSAILNIDSRASAEMDEFVAAFGAAALYEKTSLPSHPMYTLPKIAWLRKHRPAEADRATPFLCLHDYLLFRITGSAVIDTSLASRTLGFHVVDAAWAETFLNIARASTKQMGPHICWWRARGTCHVRCGAKYRFAPIGAVGHRRPRPSLLLSRFWRADGEQWSTAPDRSLQRFVNASESGSAHRLVLDYRREANFAFDFRRDTSWPSGAFCRRRGLPPMLANQQIWNNGPPYCRRGCIRGSARGIRNGSTLLAPEQGPKRVGRKNDILCAMMFVIRIKRIFRGSRCEL